MPLEVFRRHQRKMLAILAILAMFSFVLADSLPRLLTPDLVGRDAVVATLFGKKVHRSDLEGMARQRFRANLVMSAVNPYLMGREAFGGLKQRDLVDALILEKEADRLGMPADPITGREWLKANSMVPLNRDNFEQLYARFSNEISQEQLLADIANQARIAKVRTMLGRPLVTPYDVFQAYRDQGERVADKLVEVPVENFVAKVGEPSSAEVQSLYDDYKDVLPDPASPTPGFKIPRRVQVEFVSVDGSSRARTIREKLTEAELQAYYENHKSEFRIPSEMPDDLFADASELTPPVLQPFAEIRTLLASRLADEKSQEEVGSLFNRLREESLIPYVDDYLTMLDEKANDPNAKVEEPKAVDLKELASKDGLAYEISPLLSREAAGRYGLISNAQVGSARMSDGRTFTQEFFDSKLGLFEPVELTDVSGTRYLARKLKDEAPRVPSLDEARPEVVRAWKMQKARPLAEKAAQDIAAKLRSEKGGKVEESQVDGYTVITVPPISRTLMGTPGPDPFAYVPQVETPIPDVAYPGEALRNAYFQAKAGEPVVAPNQPQTSYYVVTLDRREPVEFAQLYAPNGEEMRYRSLAGEEAGTRQDEAWMNRLRRQAGLPANWTPPDEAEAASSQS